MEENSERSENEENKLDRIQIVNSCSTKYAEDSLQGSGEHTHYKQQSSLPKTDIQTLVNNQNETPIAKQVGP
jgi:hypothetical protein